MRRLIQIGMGVKKVCNFTLISKSGNLPLGQALLKS
jgi:hypothetical protein